MKGWRYRIEEEQEPPMVCWRVFFDFDDELLVASVCASASECESWNDKWQNIKVFQKYLLFLLQIMTKYEKIGGRKCKTNCAYQRLLNPLMCYNKSKNKFF